VLDVAYEEHGPPDGPPVVLLHGFPYDVHAYDEVAPLLAARGLRCLVPYLRGFGPTRFLDATTLRSGQQAALGSDLLAFMDALGVRQAVLGGYDWGGRAACVVAALWPERVRGLVSCGRGYNIQDLAKGEAPLAPEQEYRLWYQHYFRTQRGRDGLAANRGALCGLLWRLWSPSWEFSDAVFEQTAGAFDNPDFLDVVIHSYRHRFGGVAGDPAYDPIEALLAGQPAIGVPAIVLLGADDGVEPPTEYDIAAPHFTGRYARRIVPGAGHNFPQEAPTVFAEALLDVG
jgi:pimeloyl-ACP methyl ester carboxylesterase